MNKETNSLIAKWYLAQNDYGIISAKDFSDWAILLLEQDFDSKNIRILASMFNADYFPEVENYFRSSLQDLDWQFPNIEECLESYARLVAAKIVDGEIKPFDGCVIMREIYNSLDFPQHLSNWISLYWAGDDLYWEGEELTAEYLDKQIVQEAKRFLSGETFIFPANTEEQPLFSKVEKGENFFCKLWRKAF